MAMPGTQEWLLIGLVVILLFGAAAIPKLARSLGRAQGEFSKAKKEFAAEAAKAEGRQPADEAAVRRAARDLGIDESGKSLDEVKRLLDERLA